MFGHHARTNAGTPVIGGLRRAAAVSLAALVATVGLLVAPWSASPALAAWTIEAIYPSLFDCQNVGEGGVNQGRWVAYECEPDYGGNLNDYRLWVNREPIPDPTPLQTVYIQGTSLKCVDVQWGNSSNGTPLQLWGCGANNAAQRWTLHSDGSIRAYGKCMDVRNRSTSNGAIIHLWDCLGAANQKWESINISGHTRMLRNPVSGRCLDAYASGTADGTRIQLWDCVPNSPGQRWGFIAPF